MSARESHVAPIFINEIDKELNALYENCKHSGFTTKEIQSIFQPLKKFTRVHRSTSWMSLGVCIIILCIAFYGLWFVEAVSWHLTAVTRLGLIELLPIWNWKYLHNAKCIWKMSEKKSSIISPNQIDCAVCETLSAIKFEKTISSEFLRKRYLNVHEPVVIVDWPEILKDSKFEIYNYLMDNDFFRNSLPCDLSTNLAKKNIYADDLLTRSHNGYFHNWFFHFRNCDIKSIKLIRLLLSKPIYLDASIPPTNTNWLIMSKNYTFVKYKKINVIDYELIIWAQLKGKNLIKLTPRNNCKHECRDLDFHLNEGESLVFISDSWEIEYMPHNLTKNVAILSEIYWDN